MNGRILMAGVRRSNLLQFIHLVLPFNWFHRFSQEFLLNKCSRPFQKFWMTSTRNFARSSLILPYPLLTNLWLLTILPTKPPGWLLNIPPLPGRGQSPLSASIPFLHSLTRQLFTFSSAFKTNIRAEFVWTFLFCTFILFDRLQQ